MYQGEKIEYEYLVSTSVLPPTKMLECWRDSSPAEQLVLMYARYTQWVCQVVYVH